MEMASKHTITLIKKARFFAKSNNVAKAEKFYLQAIGDLKPSAYNDQRKAELWTTEAEYLIFKAKFLTDNETVEDSRKRTADALRLLHKTSKLNIQFKTNVNNEIRQIIDNSILAIGCILPENENQVHVSCPIRIRNTGVGKIGFSSGMFFEQAICSICERDVLDPECSHIVGEKYDGKECYTTGKGLTIDHVSMTENPKDPNCKIEDVWFPKKDFYEGLPKEEIEKKEKEKLPFVCNICRIQKVKPTEIDVVTFFKMQHLEL
jgi:hypothetical protein